MTTPTLPQIKTRLTTTYYELVKIETSTVYNLTNAPFDVSYDSTTYESIGALLALDELESNMNFEVPKITLSINGLVEMNNDGEYFIETMLGLDYIDRPVTIYRSYFDQGTQIGTIEVFKGFIENARHTNGASQQFYATKNSLGTDTGLDNCSEVQKEIIWKQ